MNARTLLALATLLLGSALFDTSSRPGPGADEPLVVFAVRHAEKAQDGPDPALTEAGAARAAVLASNLRSAGIDAVHSSDYARTRETAAPTGALFGVETELYDLRDLPALVDALREARGRHLIVGHSNTTPDLVALLGGDPGPAIDEAGEYDRLYVVTVGATGATSSVLLRYGEPFAPVKGE
jgi:phosphohistidine phosphatase SixA